MCERRDGRPGHPAIDPNTPDGLCGGKATLGGRLVCHWHVRPRPHSLRYPPAS